MPPSSTETLFAEAVAAVRSGERLRARDLLTRLIKENKNDPDYWVWMSAVVDTSKERVYCLKEAVRLNPGSAAARRGLAMLGLVPPDAALLLPARAQKRNWQSQLQWGEEVRQSTPPWPVFVLMGAALLLVIGLIGYAVFGTRREPARAQIVGERWPTATITPTVTVTPTLKNSPVAPLQGTTPLWMLLPATYTPTPLYVNTPHSIAEAYRSGIRAYEQQDWETMRRSMAQVITLQPGAPDVWFHVGESYRLQQDYAEALSAYQSAIDVNPNFAPAYLGRAQANLQEQADLRAVDGAVLEAARIDLDKAITLDPALVEARVWLGRVLMAQDNLSAALEAFDRAVQSAPQLASAYLLRGQARLANKDAQGALKDALQVNQLDFTSLEGYRLQAAALQGQGKIADSLRPLQTYLLYVSGDADAYVMLARIRAQENNTAAAAEAYARALALTPDNLVLRSERANWFYKNKAYEAALEDYNEILKADAKNFDVRISTIACQVSLQQYKEAYQQADRALTVLAKTDPERAAALFWRAQALQGLSESLAELRNWQALLALPAGSAQPEWLALARERVAELTRLTPTLTATATRQPTATPRPTQTRQPTRTPRP